MVKQHVGIQDHLQEWCQIDSVSEHAITVRSCTELESPGARVCSHRLRQELHSASPTCQNMTMVRDVSV